jgi:hypothetical protein
VEDEEYTLGKSFMKRNTSFDARNSRSPEVAATMEREGGEERKKEDEEERVRLNRYALMGTSLSGALLWSKGASEGEALLSTVVRARGRPATSTPWHLRVGLRYRIYFFRNIPVKYIF